MQALEIRHDGPVTHFTLNRPEVRNALNDVMLTAIKDAFMQLSDDTRVVVLSGEGKVFCAGADLEWMKKSADYTQQQNEDDARKLHAFFEAVQRCPKVVIARVHGAAMGGALGLLACCDLVAAESSTRFCFAEARIGLVPAVIAPFVVAKMGEGAARRWFLTAEAFDAQQAQLDGLVHDVAQDEQALDARIAQWTKDVLKNGPQALAEAKGLLLRMRHQTPDATRADTVDVISRVRVSKEGQEGVTAFLEKRKPRW